MISPSFAREDDRFHEDREDLKTQRVSAGRMLDLPLDI
jgi:hypothetical protein